MYLYDKRPVFIAVGQDDGSVKISSGKSGGRLYAYSEGVIYYWKTYPGRRIASHMVDAAITRHAAENGFAVIEIRRAGLSETIPSLKPLNRTSRQTREAQKYMNTLFKIEGE